MDAFPLVQTEQVTIAFLGKRVPWRSLRTPSFIEIAAADFCKLGVPKPNLQRLLLPHDSKHEGFRAAKLHPNMQGDTATDAMVLNQSGQALAAATRDCVSIIVTSEAGQVGYAHGARAALAPRPGSSNVLSNLLSLMTANENITDKWRVDLIGGICGSCFEHEHDHIDVLGFKNMWTSMVLPPSEHPEKTGLDLPKAVTMQLVSSGLNPENIFHDGVCTFENEALGSKRREPEGDHNLVLVYRH